MKQAKQKLSHFEALLLYFVANYRPAIRFIFPRKSGRITLLSGLGCNRFRLVCTMQNPPELRSSPFVRGNKKTLRQLAEGFLFTVTSILNHNFTLHITPGACFACGGFVAAPVVSGFLFISGVMVHLKQVCARVFEMGKGNIIILNS